MLQESLVHGFPSLQSVGQLPHSIGQQYESVEFSQGKAHLGEVEDVNGPIDMVISLHKCPPSSLQFNLGMYTVNLHVWFSA